MVSKYQALTKDQANFGGCRQKRDTARSVDVKLTGNLL
jgi:hypothetical protein